MEWGLINGRTGMVGGSKPLGRQLGEDESNLLVSLLINEREQKPLPEHIKTRVNDHLATQIIKKRIETANLPISFSDMAYLAIPVFCLVPGHVVLLLIDCLEEFEGKEVTVDKLCMLYPAGFYTQEEFEKIIDNRDEFSKRKWSYLY